jgi:hypothetical protein
VLKIIEVKKLGKNIKYSREIYGTKIMIEGGVNTF